MEMKLVIPPPPSLDMLKMTNIPFTSTTSSNCSTPYISAPSSPQRPFNFFCSAPTTPRRFPSGDYNQFSVVYDDADTVPSAVVPFNWEFKPGVPKTSNYNEDQANENEADDDNFEFEFSGQLDMMVRPSLSSADELFDGGKIRPLKPPPPIISTLDSPKSPISKFRQAISPRQKKSKDNYQDPFETALKNTAQNIFSPNFNDQKRGRSKEKSTNRKGISRSLSPLRVTEFALLHSPQNQEKNDQNSNHGTGTSSSRWGSKKWRLKDLLLFRSASEGRASTSGKDPLSLRKKYFGVISSNRRVDEEGSFRSSCSMGDGSVSRRRGQVSAHELHYTANRAVSEEMKKKTSLPYKHGLLGCLGFNPLLNDISKAFGSFGP